MVGALSGFVKRVKELSSNASSHCCVIHQQTLTSRTSPSTLQFASYIAIKMVTFTKKTCVKYKVVPKASQGHENGQHNTFIQICVDYQKATHYTNCFNCEGNWQRSLFLPSFNAWLV